jgi:hypothetical protein
MWKPDEAKNMRIYYSFIDYSSVFNHMIRVFFVCIFLAFYIYEDLLEVYHRERI